LSLLNALSPAVSGVCGVPADVTGRCAAALCCSVLRATAELASFAFGSLHSNNRSESVHEARCARARKPCAARRCLNGRPAAHTAHREISVATRGAGSQRLAPHHNAGCKAGGRAVGAPLWRRAPEESRVAPRSGEAKERFWPWRVQRPCPNSTRSDPSISRSAGDPQRSGERQSEAPTALPSALREVQARTVRATHREK